MDMNKIFAKNIRKHWKGSWYKLAKDAGIPYSTLGNIILARRGNAQIDVAYKISKALKVPLGDLLK